MTTTMTTAVPALRAIGVADMADIALGGALLGAGGGGDPYIGRLLAERALAEHGPVAVIGVDELADDALVVPVAMMGAPTVMTEKLPRGDEAAAALAALEKHLGRRADAIFCIEAGGLNSTIPIAVAADAGLPVVDGDGMGRAFPELQMVSMTLHDVRACPMTMADEHGNAAVLNAVDNRATEKFARALTVEMGGAALIALYPMSGAETKRAALRGSLSLIRAVGAMIGEEQRADRNPAERLAAELGGVCLFEGRVRDIERRTEGGFARGRCRLNGSGRYRGERLILEFQNEFLIARDINDDETDDEDGAPRALTPDLICVLDLDLGLPITTEQLRYGFRVSVLGLPCDPQWRSDQGLALVGPGYFGYDLDYRSLEELNPRPANAEPTD